MAKADVDILVPHCGLTGGGFIGAKETITMEEAVQSFNELYDAARVVKPDIIALAHGGPIASVEDVEWFVNHTSAAGFVAASSIERLPVEKAVSETARSFKRIGCKNGKVSFEQGLLETPADGGGCQADILYFLLPRESFFSDRGRSWSRFSD